MDRMEVLQIIKEILEKANNYAILENYIAVDEHTELVKDLSMDSIQILELLIDIEARFSITFDFQNISYSDIVNIGTVIDLVCDIL